MEHFHQQRKILGKLACASFAGKQGSRLVCEESSKLEPRMKRKASRRASLKGCWKLPGKVGEVGQASPTVLSQKR